MTSKELTNLRREMDNLFDRFFNMDFPFTSGLMKEGRWRPKIDVIGREGDIRVKAEIQTS